MGFLTALTADLADLSSEKSVLFETLSGNLLGLLVYLVLFFFF